MTTELQGKYNSAESVARAPFTMGAFGFFAFVEAAPIPSQGARTGYCRSERPPVPRRTDGAGQFGVVRPG